MKINLTIPLSFLLFLFLFSSCQDDDISDESEISESSTTSSNAIEGILRIKLNAEKTSTLSLSVKSDTISTSISNIDSLLTSIGATSFKRTFPYSGKFEARTIAEGLNLWYDVKYDTTAVSLSSIVSQFEDLSEIDVTETIKSIKNERCSYKKIGPFPIASSVKTTSLSVSDYPFDDEYLSYQWHYYNDGSVTDAIEGADINLFDAWLKQKGSEDVIVAIVDGGIDYDHEDLVDNIWINDSESSGSSNSDDDDNGYDDDIYGYNFVSNSGTIEPNDHGTHVAGTIGAMNGNDIGVCGVAGGDADTPGVRLMSCQVFETDEDDNDTSAENFEEAIKYAADNGAVICQNSWGYDGATSLPESMQDAIDYFIKYAGYDENGDQTGPMAGGIVIFAAGNDETSTDAYPAMYSEVVAVAASNPDYTISYYSNYGSWVDITAPGGTDEQNGLYDDDCLIASTVNDDGYAYMGGTSMACPHVSGVAALILSEYGGSGYTPEMLKTRLYMGAIDLDDYNSDYEGMLGDGLINASATLSDYDSTPPEAVTDLSATVSSNEVTLSWSVTSDDDDVKPTGYKIYYATTSDDVDASSSSVSSTAVLVGLLSVGDTITASISDLDFSTTYYFTVVGYDVLGSYSDYSNIVSATTDANSAPIITSDEGDTFELAAHETKTVTLDITEPDDQDYSWEFTDESGNASASESGSSVEVTINGLSADAGDYTSTLTVTDSYDASSSFTINYTVLENHAPVVSDTIENLYIGDPDATTTIDLSEHFSDEDGEDLSYELTYESDMLSGSVSSDVLSLTSESNGLSTFSVTASDARGESATITFEIMVRDDDETIDIYPNPVTDFVNFRMGEDVDGTLQVKAYNSNGVLVETQNVDISTFSPGSMDLSDYSSGEYELQITYEEIEISENIVKL
jgi:subtilisin family serine protease